MLWLKKKIKEMPFTNEWVWDIYSLSPNSVFFLSQFSLFQGQEILMKYSNYNLCDMAKTEGKQGISTIIFVHCHL